MSTPMELKQQLARGNRSVTHSCPQCGASVKCDVELGKSVCWCFSYPEADVDEGTQCLCSRCLKAAAKP